MHYKNGVNLLRGKPLYTQNKLNLNHGHSHCSGTANHLTRNDDLIKLISCGHTSLRYCSPSKTHRKCCPNHCKCNGKGDARLQIPRGFLTSFSLKQSKEIRSLNFVNPIIKPRLFFRLIHFLLLHSCLICSSNGTRCTRPTHWSIHSHVLQSIRTRGSKTNIFFHIQNLKINFYLSIRWHKRRHTRRSIRKPRVRNVDRCPFALLHGADGSVPTTNH